MSVNELRVGDVGTRIDITVNDGGVAMDISSATVMKFVFRKPGGVVIEKNATFTTDGKDGKLYYVIMQGDFDDSGTWRVQVALELPVGKWKSDIIPFEVHGNL